MIRQDHNDPRPLQRLHERISSGIEPPWEASLQPIDPDAPKILPLGFEKFPTDLPDPTSRRSLAPGRTLTRGVLVRSQRVKVKTAIRLLKRSNYEPEVRQHSICHAHLIRVHCSTLDDNRVAIQPTFVCKPIRHGRAYGPRYSDGRVAAPCGGGGSRCPILRHSLYGHWLRRQCRWLPSRASRYRLRPSIMRRTRRLRKATPTAQ